MELIEKDIFVSSSLNEEFTDYVKSKKIKDIDIDYKVVVIYNKAWCLNNYPVPLFTPPVIFIIIIINQNSLKI